MLAYADGAEIEQLSSLVPEWQTNTFPVFNWHHVEFRVKRTPDYINWDHVSPEYKWMARSELGAAYFFKEKPVSGNEPVNRENYFTGGPKTGNWFWGYNQIGTKADTHASYKRGTVDWKNSLVSREEWEADQ
jgi:hypothetical protein